MAAASLKEGHIAHELLLRAHPEEIASDIFVEKVQRRPLYLKPAADEASGSSNARAARQRARAEKEAQRRKSRKPRPLSAKQKRALNIYEIPKSERKYEIYLPLWRMWTAYIREILGLQAGGTYNFVLPKTAGPLLASADFHGAIVEVARSRCVGRVGLKGIVVKDTMFTYEIITEKNELKVIPKEHTVFKVEVPLETDASKVDANYTQKGSNNPRNLVFELYGSSFENRAPDRANKKVKIHLPPDL